MLSGLGGRKGQVPRSRYRASALDPVLQQILWDYRGFRGLGRALLSNPRKDQTFSLCCYGTMSA